MFKYISRIRVIIGIMACTILVSNSVHSQRYKLRRIEVLGGIGSTQVFGDIGGTADENNLYGLKDITFDETRPAATIAIRYKLDPLYSLKLNAIYGLGYGDDKDSRNTRGRTFKSHLAEISLQGEFYLIGEDKKFGSGIMFNRRGMVNNFGKIAVYGFAGAGAIMSFPSVKYEAGWEPSAYDLTKDKEINVAFPFGIGGKYIIDDRYLINFELGYRYTLSDYIDGFTQSLASQHKDVYYFLLVSIGYKIKTSSKGIPAIFDKRYRSYGRGGRSTPKTTKTPRSRKGALK